MIIYCSKQIWSSKAAGALMKVSPAAHVVWLRAYDTVGISNHLSESFNSDPYNTITIAKCLSCTNYLKLI